MNKTYRAVPVEEFYAGNHKPGDYAIFEDDDVTRSYFDGNDFDRRFVTHVLLPVEDEWISDLPNDQECAEWYDINIGNDPEKPCSASSGIYKFREWLKERNSNSQNAISGIKKKTAIDFMIWYNRNEEKSIALFNRYIQEGSHLNK